MMQFGSPERLPWYSGARLFSLPWHLEYVGPMLFYMTLGYFFRRYGEARFDRLNRRWLWPLLLGLYVLVVMVLPLRLGGIFGFPRVLFLYLCALLLRLWPRSGDYYYNEVPPAYVLAAAVALTVAVLLVPVVWLILRYLPILAGKTKHKKTGSS